MGAKPMVSRLLAALELPTTLTVLDHLVEAISELSCRQRRQVMELLERLEDSIAQSEDAQDRHECDQQRRALAKRLGLA